MFVSSSKIVQLGYSDVDGYPLFWIYWIQYMQF